MSKVLVGMSGGVDSLVAALLLKKSGYEVTGATMRLLSDEINSSQEEDIKDACEQAKAIGIPHIVIDLRQEFSEEVIKYFSTEYMMGRTPNPCVICNQKIKMGAMLDRAIALGFDYLATGHYARIIFNDISNRYELHKGLSGKKDQSYVLYGLTQEQLSHILMPLGSMTKEEVKDIAIKNNILDINRKESQDICFIPNGNYSSFLKEHSNVESIFGNFINSKGEILGEHLGITRYTVGQRKGIGLAFGEPVFVTSIDPYKNTVTLGPEEELYRLDMIVTDVNYIEKEKIPENFKVFVKIRYAGNPFLSTLHTFSDNSLKVIFEQPQRAVTPGQSAVFYNGDSVIGGGIIKN